MRKIPLLFLATLASLGIRVFAQNSPFSVNNTGGQSVTNLTSTIGYGAQFNIQRFNNTGSYYSFETGAGSNDDLRLYVNSNWSTPIMSYKTNGYVGIGTSTPQQKLHVEGSLYINTGSLLINQTASTNAKFYFSKLGSYTWDLGTETSDP